MYGSLDRGHVKVMSEPRRGPLLGWSRVSNRNGSSLLAPKSAAEALINIVYGIVSWRVGLSWSQPGHQLPGCTSS